MNDFLPEDYVAPVSDTKYLKFKKGNTRFRFISSPITGWVYFIKSDDGKTVVHRVRPNGKAPAANLNAKHFWAAIVLDYSSNSLKVLEITQKTIRDTILDLNANKAWGSPKDYDLCVVREGDGMDTEYRVMPEPKSEVPSEIIKMAEGINLDALYEGVDPFDSVQN